MDLENNIEKNIKIENSQNNFLNSILGKTINYAIDVGLRTILPDLIEEQIIDIKNALLENGLKGGIKTSIDSTIDFAKSTTGIFTGKFENIDQINIAIGNGGVIETLSNVLDDVVNKIYKKGYINDTMHYIIKNGKNTILDSIANNIKKELNKQNSLIENFEKNIESWKNAYNKKDLNKMNKIFNEIEKNRDKIIPLENLCEEIRNIESIHNYIKNAENKTDITDIEKELIKTFSNI